MWFLNCRTNVSGGDVRDVLVMDGTNTFTTPPPQFLNEVSGQDVLIGIHGFNVHQAGGIDHLQQWKQLLTLPPNTVFLGGLWPGDSAWLGALEYAVAVKPAMRSGASIATFVNKYLISANSVSFVSHSLGARVALNAIGQLAAGLPVRRLIMMAPAVDDNCLTKEFASAAKRIDDIVVMASKKDDVLKLAFPLGNPISGIFGVGHPFWHAAMGREGPVPRPGNVTAPWPLPDGWDVGHSDYLPPQTPFQPGYMPTPYVLPVSFPGAASALPAPMPAGYLVNGNPKDWLCGWTAAWTSVRFP